MLSSHDKDQHTTSDAQAVTDPLGDRLLSTDGESVGLGRLDSTTATYDFEKNRVASPFGDSEDSDHEEPSARSTLLRPPVTPRPSPIARRLSFVEEDEGPPQPPPVHAVDDKPVTWGSLPRKGQLAVMTLARLSEPLTQTSLGAYVFYQLKSFDPSLSDSQISYQAGVLQASFTAAQFVTAVLWGRAADTDWIGRKRVLLIGLWGTCLSVLGFGFSRSFVQAAVFRTIGGALNGNIGVMRTMISEIVKEKKYQSRAFLLLPMCFNIGVVLGPIMGGAMADPFHSFRGIFGPGSLIGGKNGVWWMEHWPYLLPNLLCAALIFVAAVGIILGLDETHKAMKDQTDYGRRLGTFLADMICRRPRHRYSEIQLQDDADSPTSIDLETNPQNRPHKKPPPKSAAKLPFSKIWTPNVLLTLLVHFLLAMHVSAFNALIFVLLPTPRAANDHPGLIHFGGGLGLPPSKVGLATAIIGIIGFPLQLLLYPRLHHKFGALKAYRLFLPFSPLAYTVIPYLVLIPNKAWLVWPALVVTLGLQVLSRTFALPGAIILINNSTPHPSVLGTIHGVAQSVSSAARTIGPIVGGWLMGEGLKHNTVGVVWWTMAIIAALGWSASWAIFEGDGGTPVDGREEGAKKECAVSR